jgi:hypothetical protein
MASSGEGYYLMRHDQENQPLGMRARRPSHGRADTPMKKDLDVLRRFNQGVTRTEQSAFWKRRSYVNTWGYRLIPANRA